MTIDEIFEWTYEDLVRGWKPIEEIHHEFVALMQGGGVSARRANDLFDDLTSCMYFYSPSMNTLVYVEGENMTSRRWLADHQSFKWVNPSKADEIAAREGFKWTAPALYYGTDDEYEGASISTAIVPDGRTELYDYPL